MRNCSIQQQLLFVQNTDRIDLSELVITESALNRSLSLFQLSGVQSITLSGISISGNNLLAVSSLFLLEQCS